MERRAKIMATLGPATSIPEILGALFEAGVDVVRLNLSHGDHDGHRTMIRGVRAVGAKTGRHIPIVLDLMGPRYRLGEIDGTLELAVGAAVRLGLQTARADLPVSAGVLDHLRPGQRVLIDNGLVELEVGRLHGDAADARVVTGGFVSARKGINLPDTRLPFEISSKDRHDIAFAVAEGVDYIAASYIGAPEHVEEVRKAVDEAGGKIPLIAKLERAAALDHLDDIVATSDAIMVARGDLGVEVPLDRVPVLQKEIVSAGRKAGRPVIVATQMLESMIRQPRPTRAEATDVANAVFDGADALMLSGETAAGDHPVAAVAIMARIIARAEDYRSREPVPARDPLLVRRRRDHDLPQTAIELPDAVSAAAVFASAMMPVRWIVAFSQGGFTARLIARYRPAAPILVFTTSDRVARQVQLVWGVRPILMETDVEHLDEVVEKVESALLERELVDSGDSIFILMGDPIREAPLTNLLRVHRVA